ncbi:uncharacterized protein STEHIDRAFT_167214 [Stereum hirsutum FP-91666 SS1]|uniref:uncharacterized protein n=1 Tax=Stereum hirsutum (strain FP-91666) TaxID=721885 RepID=UPI000440F60C|nr:uncharacterized protein STEHIDRAFT_167214 [Stereum hirsutum FP-91666 SS1]EIM87739.1 hypothetical protein STEHIDRAFT_167214 [Stereum hirsutum FP-91666 SS1]
MPSAPVSSSSSSSCPPSSSSSSDESRNTSVRDTSDSVENDATQDENNPFVKASRWISRGYDLFTGLRTLFEVGMALDELVMLEETEENSEPGLTLVTKIGIVHGLDDDEVLRCQRAYKNILAHVPGLAKCMAEFVDAGDLTDFWNKLQKVRSSANSGKNEDSCKFKKSLAEYAGATSTEKNRGFWSPFYGRLLTPSSLLVEYDADPVEFCRQARLPGGDVRITDAELPSLVYPCGVCNPEDILEGFTQTELLVRFGRMVLQGPTYAMEEPKAPMQRGNSKKHDIRNVTEDFVAYCVTQVRIAVSGNGFVELDGLFHNVTLYSTVVSLIRLNPAKKKSILAFWNLKCFGHEDGYVQKKRKAQAGEPLSVLERARLQNTAQVSPEVAPAGPTVSAATELGTGPNTVPAATSTEHNPYLTTVSTSRNTGDAASVSARSAGDAGDSLGSTAVTTSVDSVSESLSEPVSNSNVHDHSPPTSISSSHTTSSLSIDSSDIPNGSHASSQDVVSVSYPASTNTTPPSTSSIFEPLPSGTESRLASAPKEKIILRSQAPRSTKKTNGAAAAKKRKAKDAVDGDGAEMPAPPKARRKLNGKKTG